MSSRPTLFLAVVVVGGMGCSCGGALTTELLGVQPLPNATGAPSGTFGVYVSARDMAGFLEPPPQGSVQVACDLGPCALVSQTTRAGAPIGVLAVIVDDSGSNSATPSTCTGCPTDPEGHRREAVALLAQRLLARAPQWRVALFDFGWYANGGLRNTRFLAGYTSHPGDIVSATKQLEAYGNTYIYDALAAVAPTAAGERTLQRSDGGTVAAHILVVTDGEDTDSTATLADALTAAKGLDVAIDAVGYGQVGDGGTVVLADRGYRDLRRLGAETGGMVTIVPTDQLSALLSTYADALVDGSAACVFNAPPGAAHVSGTVSVSGASGPRPFLYDEVP